MSCHNDLVPPPTPTQSPLPSQSAYFWGDWDGWWTSSCHGEEPEKGPPYLHQGVQGAAKGWASGFKRCCSQCCTFKCFPGSCYGLGNFRWGRWHRTSGRLDPQWSPYIELDLEIRVARRWENESYVIPALISIFYLFNTCGPMMLEVMMALKVIMKAQWCQLPLGQLMKAPLPYPITIFLNWTIQLILRIGALWVERYPYWWRIDATSAGHCRLCLVYYCNESLL